MTAWPQAPVPPRRILVNGRPIRLRWLQQTVWLFLAANIGAWIISALYYLVVQVRWHAGGHTFQYLKPDWDHLFGSRDASAAGEENPQRHLPRWPWPPLIRERAAGSCRVSTMRAPRLISRAISPLTSAVVRSR